MDNVLKTILKIKKNKGITDAQFVKDLGFYSSIVSEWKNGNSKSYEKHLPKIANYLGVSVDYLLGRTSPPSTPASAPQDELKSRLDQNYLALNQEGKKALVALSDDMVAGGRYELDA